MKKSVLLGILISPILAFGQLNEHFNDGDFTCGPTWNSSNLGSDFLIYEQALRSNSATANSSFFISTRNNLAINTRWQFKLRLDLATSGSNYTDIYLISDKADLKSAQINGYFIRVGDSNDDISLYRRSGASSSISKIIDGLNSSVSPGDTSIRITVSRDMSGKFKLQRLINETEEYTEGEILDTMFKTTEYFGILVQQSTATFFNKHYFDDIQIAALDDSSPPRLISAELRSPQLMELLFSEPMDTSSIKSIVNYRLNNMALPSTTRITTSDGIVFSIQLAEPIAEGEYTLEFSMLKDLQGEPVSDGSRLISYRPPYIARPGDIIINEVLPDPTPKVGLPEVEFVEIHNRSSREIDLEGWTLSDPTTTGQIGKHRIPANGYLILTARMDTTLFRPYGQVAGLSAWPSLNNAGDILKLRNPQNVLIDSLSYSDTWFKESSKRQGGWSLERSGYGSVCDDIPLWTAALDAQGGTPGKQNPGAAMLRIDSVRVINDRRIAIHLNRAISPVSLNSSSIQVEGLTPPAQISVDATKRMLEIEFETPFENGRIYHFQKLLIEDCGENKIDTAASGISFQFLEEPEREYKLVINEIFADPTPSVGMPEAEFVELFNPTTQEIDLKGMRFGSFTREFGFESGTISPGGYLILCPEKDTLKFKQYGPVKGISNWPVISNTGATLYLKNNKGRIFQDVTFDIGWFKSDSRRNGGYSIELIDPTSVCDANQNWELCDAAEGATPGKVNSAYRSFGAQPLLRLENFEFLDNQRIMVRLSGPIDSAMATSVQNYQLNNGLGMPASVQLLRPDFTRVILNFAHEIQRGLLYTLSLSNITDCAGRNMEALNTAKQHYYPRAISSNDILISEILFDPRPGGVDFVEVYNHSREILDLKELKIARRTDTIRDPTPVSISPLLFKPGDYLAITIDPTILSREYTIKKIENILKISHLPPFNNDSGTVVLLSEERLIDKFSYAAKMHEPIYRNLEGISLERSSFSREANETGNFRSATAAAGYATPGYENSQKQDKQVEMEEFQIRSATFSPDQDGFEDLFHIEYHLEKAGYIANATIFNEGGTPVRHLLRNFILNQNGDIYWDGIMDDHHLASVGIYLLDLRLFDLEGNRKRFKKAFALALKF